jgi:hypothetical protein
VTRNRITGPNPLTASPAPGEAVPPVGAPVVLDASDAQRALDVLDAPGAPDAADSRDALHPALMDDVNDEDRTTSLRRRHRALVIVSSAAIVVLAVFGIWGFTITEGGARPATHPARRAPAAQPAITVEPIPVAPRPAAAQADPHEIEMMPEEPSPRDTAGAALPPRVHRPPVHKEARPPAPQLATFTREQLGQKFQQVRREYDDYKTKFGSRLEREWGELATFIQYMPASDDDAGRREAARRLDAFHGRMRE